MTIQEIIAKGYRRVSIRYGHVSRVDREDWKEEMARRHAPWDPEGEGERWVECLGDGAADHYRRCYSTDVLEIGRQLALKIPPSSWDTTGFIKDC